MNEQLYDEEFISRRPKLNKLKNSWLSSILSENSDGLMKSLLEDWYTRIPEKMKTKLYSRLRSFKDKEIISAIYELSAYFYCLDQGWEIEYEPVIGGKTPDFKVTTISGFEFIFEVTSLYDSEVVRISEERMWQFASKIAEVETKHVYHLNFFEYPSDSFRPSVAKRVVQEWLDEIEEVSERTGCSFGKVIAGCNFSIDIYPEEQMPEGPGRMFSVGFPPADSLNYQRRVRDILNEKSKLYSSKKTGLPLVIMIGDGIGYMRASSDVITESLYGHLLMTFGGKTTNVSRSKIGYFSPNSVDGKLVGKNTGVSAVVYSSIKGSQRFHIEVLHNPIPLLNITNRVFKNVPQYYPINIDGKHQMHWLIDDAKDYVDYQYTPLTDLAVS